MKIYLLLILLLFFPIIVFILNKFSYLIKLIDYPSERKIHNKNTPLTGGISIFIILLIAFLNLKLEIFYYNLILCSFLILLIGIFDDRFTISPNLRLLFQTAICLTMSVNSINIQSFAITYDATFLNLFFLFYENSNFLQIIFTTFCLIIVINSFNFIDGIDGLCSGLAIISLFFIICFSYFEIDTNSFLFLLIFFTCLNLFAFFNIASFLKFKSFLGDSGSTMIGFILGCLLIYYSQGKNMYMYPYQVIWIAPLPFFDFARVIISRLYYKTNPFKPKKDHIHHIILNNKNSSKKTLLILLILNFLLIVIGLSFSYLLPSYSILTFVFFFLCYLLIVNLKIAKLYEN